MDITLSYKDTLLHRMNNIGKGCSMHFGTSPLKVVRGSKQYLYDEFGTEYLDCVNNTAHVGHCHPHVVNVGQAQMAKLGTCNGFLSDAHSIYAKKISETLPENLSVCYFVNSGSEANDLALRLAEAYTRKSGVLVIENAFHGSLRDLVEVSPRHFKRPGFQKKQNVFVAPCPDLYQGKYRDDDEHATEKYVMEVKQILQQTQGQIGAFLCEPLMTLCGVIVPPKNYLKDTFRAVRESGGLCILDEVQTGLGRTGEGYWAFQSHDVVPDIMTCGKPLGNGHPLAMVATTKAIADCMDEFLSAFGGNPVSCSIGSAVVDVINNENLVSSARCVGRVLMENLLLLKDKHPNMGQVRGNGLYLGIEIVTDKKSRQPARKMAEQLAHRMRQKQILMANEGPNKNVMYISPPMCFTCDNARHLIKVLDEALSDVEKEDHQDYTTSMSYMYGMKNIDLFPSEDDCGEEFAPPPKRQRFEDLD